MTQTQKNACATWHRPPGLCRVEYAISASASVVSGEIASRYVTPAVLPPVLQVSALCKKKIAQPGVQESIMYNFTYSGNPAGETASSNV
jgi:hypothetical protein